MPGRENMKTTKASRGSGRYKTDFCRSMSDVIGVVQENAMVELKEILWSGRERFHGWVDDIFGTLVSSLVKGPVGYQQTDGETMESLPTFKDRILHS
jgi:hypothetical protein